MLSLTLKHIQKQIISQSLNMLDITGIIMMLVYLTQHRKVLINLLILPKLYQKC